MKLQITKGKQTRPQRVLIYGVEGIGKSTLAAGCPGPVLFIDTEDGSGHLNVDRVQVRTMAELQEVVKYLRSNADGYKTLVLDTVDNLYRMVTEAVLEREGWANIEKPGYGKGYAVVTAEFSSLIASVLSLINNGINVVLIAHAKIEKITPPDTAEYTKYMPKVNAPNRQAEAARELIVENCDAVLFCHYEISVRTGDDGRPGRAVGSHQRRLYAQSAPAWQAKNRCGLPADNAMSATIWSTVFGTSKRPLNVTTEERELLEAYFVGLGKLTPGAALEDLPAEWYNKLEGNLQTALDNAKRKANNG